MEFRSLYRHGFARVAACGIAATVADPLANARAVIAAAGACAADGAALAVFPELCLSSYAIDDLLLQAPLLDAVGQALGAVVDASRNIGAVVAVGAPVRFGHRLFNAAVVIHRGRVLGAVPKSYLPTYREFYEGRHFAAGLAVAGETITLAGQAAPFGTDLLFAAEDLPGFVLGVEVCEDLWVPVPPSGLLAASGATVIANMSASPVTIGRARLRATLCAAQSVRCLCAYVYTAAGAGESTTDLAWDGQVTVHELGTCLAEGARFAPEGGGQTMADIDLEAIGAERLRMGTFNDAARAHARPMRRIGFRLQPPGGDLGLRRRVERFPFVPADPARLADDCREAYNIQVAGLAQRLRATGLPRPVVGVSGGLDSTQALIVCARTMDLLGQPRHRILGVTLPGLATGAESRDRALRLMAALGVDARELDIRPAALRMLADLGHPFGRGEAVHDVTFENVQAGLRTDYLFRLANGEGGLVVGTGDLSELALGWCTYGVGDQMSHYGVNAGVPKTLIQHLIRWAIAAGLVGDAAASVLDEVVRAEISPELVPGADVRGTEALIGPYALQDFTLFHLLRYGFRPSRIAYMALTAWGDAGRGDWPDDLPEAARRAYGLAEIRHWMGVFLRRFFANQFKRSALPNGPKVVAGGTLSPRGEWRAPSDAVATAWLADLDGVPDG